MKSRTLKQNQNGFPQKKQTNKLNKQTNKQTNNKQTTKQTNKETNEQRNKKKQKQPFHCHVFVAWKITPLLESRWSLKGVDPEKSLNRVLLVFFGRWGSINKNQNNKRSLLRPNRYSNTVFNVSHYIICIYVDIYTYYVFVFHDIVEMVSSLSLGLNRTYRRETTQRMDAQKENCSTSREASWKRSLFSLPFYHPLSRGFSFSSLVGYIYI